MAPVDIGKAKSGCRGHDCYTGCRFRYRISVFLETFDMKGDAVADKLFCLLERVASRSKSRKVWGISAPTVPAFSKMTAYSLISSAPPVSRCSCRCPPEVQRTAFLRVSQFVFDPLFYIAEFGRHNLSILQRKPHHNRHQHSQQQASLVRDGPHHRIVMHLAAAGQQPHLA